MRESATKKWMIVLVLIALSSGSALAGSILPDLVGDVHIIGESPVMVSSALNISSIYASTGTVAISERGDYFIWALEVEGGDKPYADINISNSADDDIVGRIKVEPLIDGIEVSFEDISGGASGDADKVGKIMPDEWLVKVMPDDGNPGATIRERVKISPSMKPGVYQMKVTIEPTMLEMP